VPDDPGHEAACLLDPSTRSAIWRGLEAGEDPRSLKQQFVESIRPTGAPS
jgi:hypothetical protein